MSPPIKPLVIYVELLDEGSQCARPVPFIPLTDGTYRLLPTPDYDSDEEHWQFPPGSVVRCLEENWSTGRVMVARELVRFESIE